MDPERKHSSHISIEDLEGVTLRPRRKEKRKKKSMINVLCCLSDSEDDEEEEHEHRQQNQQSLKVMEDSSMPHKQQAKRAHLTNSEQKVLLNIFGNVHQKHYCLAKITQKNFFVDLLQKKQQFQLKQRLLQIQDQDNQVQDIGTILNNMNQRKIDSNNMHQFMRGPIAYQLFHRGVRANQKQIQTALPEKVLSYIAKKTKLQQFQSFLDAYGRCGNAGIIFAQEKYERIIMLDENGQSLNNIRTNAMLYEVLDQIDLIQADFAQFRMREIDLAFVKFEHTNPTEDKPFKINQNITQDLDKIIPHSLSLCKNVIFVFPKFCTLQEIGEYLGLYMSKFEKGINKIEIQFLQIDGYLSHYIVYVGEIAGISHEQELEFIADYILQDSQNVNSLKPQTIKLLMKIETLGNLKWAMDYLLGLYESQTAETMMAKFLSYIVEQQIVGNQEINQIFEVSSFSELIQNQTPKYNINTMTPHTFAGCDQKQSLLEQKAGYQQSFRGNKQSLVNGIERQSRFGNGVSFQQSMDRSEY